MTGDCHNNCGVLECWRGEEQYPFYEMTIPIELTSDYAKNLCTFYNSKEILYISKLLQVLINNNAKDARYMWIC